MYKEIHIETKEQVAIIQPDVESEGIILKLKEIDSNEGQFRLYLTPMEAQILGKELIRFAEENGIYT